MCRLNMNFSELFFMLGPAAFVNTFLVFWWDRFDVIAGKELFKLGCSCIAYFPFCVHEVFLLGGSFRAC